MNYEYYKIFYCVGKHKNITKAAAELFSSQPAVTRVIHNMENELSCKLFVRTKKGVELTHEGELLYDYVAVACQHLIKAEEELSRSVSLDGGTIYIGTTITALTCYLFEFLNSYRALYPKVKFKIQTSSTAKIIDLLHSGSVDMAFVTTPCDAPPPLNVTEILEFHDILIGGKQYAYLKDEQLIMADLKQYPFISLHKKMQLRQFLDGVFYAYGINFTPDIEADDADIMILMVANGWGLAFAPEPMTLEKRERGELIKIPFKDELPTRKVCLITDPQRPQTLASREMCRMVKKQAKNMR